MIAQTLRTLSVWTLLIAPVFLPTVLSQEGPVFELCADGTFGTVTEEGAITTPNYPGYYFNDADCSVLITASPGKIVLLTLDYIDTEECCDDLYVYDADNRDGSPLISLAGYDGNIGGYRSTGQNLYVRFVSDLSTNYTGLLANVTFIANSSCDVTLNQEGQIMSPNYPANYDNFMSCDYFITAGPGQLVKLIFRDFSLQESVTCADDNVTVFDGSASDGKPFGGFVCDGTLPGDVVSSGRTLQVVFTSGPFYVDTGFLADVIFFPEISVKRGVTLKQGRGWSGGLIADLEFNIGMCEWSRIEVTFPRRVHKVQVTGCDADLDVSVKSELNSGGNQGWMSVATIVPGSSDRAPPGADGNTRLSIFAKIWRELRRFKANIKADIHYYTC